MDDAPKRKAGPPPTRRGYQPHEVVSALQKAVRRSDPDAACYWGLELALSGFGPWLWSRLRVIAVEDCSPEVIGLVADIHALNEHWVAAQKGRGGGELFVARALISLAIAPKSRVVDWALLHHASDDVERREVPDHALDKHTLRGRRMGRGMQHFIEEASRLEPWTGSLADLENGYRERSIAACGAIDGTAEPAQNDHTVASGQLPADSSMSHAREAGQLGLDDDHEEDR